MRSVLTALCLFASTAHAVPAQFTHQGRLLDADGAPLEGDATIIFRVTNADMGGTAIWEETITVPLSNGFYSAVLGTDDDNPLDTTTFAEAPAWLELQLDGEPAMFPRSPINAVPYASMATVAEELSGGPVDASDISVGGTPVVNESGEWVGPAPTVSWDDLTDVPADFADGIDDDTPPESDSFADLGVTCIDGDIPVWDGTTEAWSCTFDQDSLADMDCTEGQIVRWNEEAVGWICSDDLDTVLSEDEVNAIVSGMGYAMASEVFSGSFLDLADLPAGLLDGDDNTQLTAAEVDAIVADNGYAMTEDLFSGLFNELTGIPDGLLDGDDNTQLSEADVDAFVENNGYASTTDIFSGIFSDLTDIPEGLIDGDDNTQLTEADVDAFVENNGYAAASDIFSGIFSDLTGIPEGLLDGDDNTQLSADEVDAIVADNGYAAASDIFSGIFSDLTDIPEGLLDGDDNTQLTDDEVKAIIDAVGYAKASELFSGRYEDLTGRPALFSGNFSDLAGIPDDLLDGDDNTQLTDEEVDAIVADELTELEVNIGSDISALLAEIETLKEQVSALEEDSDAGSGTVMYGDYTVNNSVDLAGLAGYTEITGELTIGGVSFPDLSPLSNLTTVGSNLTISGNSELESLTGLDSLTMVGNDLKIEGNSSLPNLDGISGLESIGGDLYIKYNDSLASLSGLASLTEIPGDLKIYNNGVLRNLTGLGGVHTIGGNLEVHAHSRLNSISALLGLYTLGGNLQVTYNEELCKSHVGSFISEMTTRELGGGYSNHANARC